MSNNDAIEDIKFDAHGNDLTFQGDTRLRKGHTEVRLNNEQLLEFVKCKEDRNYFIEKYIKINIPGKGFSHPNIYDWQKKFYDVIDSSNRIVTVAPRQSGKCVDFFTKIKIRNHKTGKVRSIWIGQFYLEQRVKEITLKILNYLVEKYL